MEGEEREEGREGGRRVRRERKEGKGGGGKGRYTSMMVCRFGKSYYKLTNSSC